MADVPVKGSDNNTYAIDTDNIGGVETQVVKLRTGDTGVDEGLVTDANPLPVSDAMVAWGLRRLLKLLGGFSFDTTSQLRVAPANISTVSTVTTVTTVTTMTTGNMSLGDKGKPATAIETSRQSFACGVGRNLIRS